MFSISSGGPALVCPEAPSLPLLGTRRRAQPAWPPPGTRVDVEARTGPRMVAWAHAGSSRNLGGSGSFAGAEGVRQAVGRVLGPGRRVQLCREKRGEGKSPGEVLRRRPRPWGRGWLCSALLPRRRPHAFLSLRPQSRPSLFSLIDWQQAGPPCPPLSPGVCPDSCPLMMPSRHLILYRVPFSPCL